MIVHEIVSWLDFDTSDALAHESTHSRTCRVVRAHSCGMFANVRRGKQGKRRQRIKQASSRQQASGKKSINKCFKYSKDALLCASGLLAVPYCCKAHVLSLALWSGCLSCVFKSKKGYIGGRVKFCPPSDPLHLHADNMACFRTNRLKSIYLATSSKRGIHNES
jgi:hypothetical protein